MMVLNNLSNIGYDAAVNILLLIMKTVFLSGLI